MKYSPSIIKQRFYEILHQCNSIKILYSDASKSEEGIGCVVTTTTTTVNLFRLFSNYSIYTAKLYGILQAVKSPLIDDKTVAIYTDSLPSMQSIRNVHSTHPRVQEIQSICNPLQTNVITVTMLWVPSHVGIPGNEKANQAAK
ncbi:uncharacterized protein [Diabrotica undecimpunctata]|uniref:uncharacterized protein n=1 Tax=Diabrotica undecimpunctata TaxID=50387 RepID=UPI003B63383D